MLNLLMRICSSLLFECDGQRKNSPVTRLEEFASRSEDRRHRVWERRYWLLSIVLTVAIAIVAVISASAAMRAVSEARRQADQATQQTIVSSRQLMDQQRAWVSIENTLVVGDLIWENGIDEKGPLQTGIIYVSFNIHNQGQTPARQLRSYVQGMFVSPFAIDLGHRPLAFDRCRASDSEHKYVSSIGLFPGEIRMTAKWPAEFRQADFEQAANSSTSSIYGQRKVDMFLLVCVSYTTVEDNKDLRHSEKLFKLRRRIGSGKSVALESIPFGTAITADDLTVDLVNWGDDSD